MNLKKPEFWLNKNIISLVLLPLTIVTFLINLFKKFSYKRKFKIKSICIGNIYVGGTGKTTLAILVNQILKKRFKTVFIKKKYNNQKDEIKLLEKNGSVISKKSRLLSLKLAEKQNYEVALLDDGLQQKNINYSLKIVCFNSSEFIGNGYLLPAGPLRENITELKNYDCVFLNGEIKSSKIKKKIKSINKNIEIFQGIYDPQNLKSFNRNKNFLMFCGIGNPNEFENTLLKYKFKLKKKFIFGDHYGFNDKEIFSIKEIAKQNKLSIITTEKDFLRLSSKQKKGIKFLKIKLKIKNLKKLNKILFNIK
tara:strand:- start:326 stop:1249 length:924 start_codon:yes stop_codon:yes gene_type:complete